MCLLRGTDRIPVVFQETDALPKIPHSSCLYKQAAPNGPRDPKGQWCNVSCQRDDAS